MKKSCSFVSEVINLSIWCLLSQHSSWLLFCWLHIQFQFMRSRLVVRVFFFIEPSFKSIQTYLPYFTIICISSTLVNLFLQFYIIYSSQDRYSTVYKPHEPRDMIFAKELFNTSI